MVAGVGQGLGGVPDNLRQPWLKWYFRVGCQSRPEFHYLEMMFPRLVLQGLLLSPVHV